MSGRGKGGKGLGKGGAKRHRKILRDNIQGITKPAIRRLARRGGVKRISGLIYEETRGVLKIFLENVIRDSVTYTEHAKRKTVTALDVVYALKRSGRTLYVIAGFLVRTLSSVVAAPSLSMASAYDGDFQLPNEILVSIFAELSPPSLALVSRLSKRSNIVAERILYASIHITDFISPESPTPWKTYLWCESVLKRLNLVDTMRKVHIRWQSDSSPPPLPQYFIAFCERLGESLQYLHFLESLEIQLGPANRISPLSREPMHAVERILKRCRFPYLQSCSIGADYTKGAAQPYTHVLAAFLAHHPGLLHLKIPDFHAALNLPTTSLHQLSTFRGSPDTAASLLPGRSIQYLALNGADSDLIRVLPMMSCTAVPILYLDLSSISARITLMRSVATYLPNIESLRVRLALRHTLHYSFTGITGTLVPSLAASPRSPLAIAQKILTTPSFMQRILTGLSAVLSAFTQLVLLDLSPTDVGGVGRADPSEELALCREWHRACPSLCRIIFPSETEFVLHHDAWLAPAAQN
ncbi:hypothetical protein D9611_012794 [Ephemerocybe angulata]|uniref:Histone H4 n=1 Tax=Ephemerocybe angulata TaxID=980116 RepID=A0A8H5FJ24_9AGAR|nr:hypothetical protein D9611_012794 [Tulosesus angulatus]